MTNQPIIIGVFLLLISAVTFLWLFATSRDSLKNNKNVRLAIGVAAIFLILIFYIVIMVTIFS
jgi:hypothetical protein